MTPKRTAITAKTMIVSIIVAAAIISAGVFAVSYFGTTKTQPCGQQVGNATRASTTNCQLGITLILGIRNATITVGHNETFDISIRNDRASNNTVGFNGFPSLPRVNQSNPAFAVDELPPVSCGQRVPAWIMVYNESGLPIPLNDVAPFTGICGETSIGIPYQFSPSQTLTETLSVGGYWRSSNISEPWKDATQSQFAPGQYTVLAFNGWNQPLMLNFTVD